MMSFILFFIPLIVVILWISDTSRSMDSQPEGTEKLEHTDLNLEGYHCGHVSLVWNPGVTFPTHSETPIRVDPVMQSETPAHVNPLTQSETPVRSYSQSRNSISCQPINTE